MAESMIQRACERFKKELSPEDAISIQTPISLNDVKAAIQQIERELAARQSLTNLQRIQPFIDAIDRYSKAVDVLANGTPFLPWIWAPLKIILQGVCDCTHALDKILDTYGQIGRNMPRLFRYVKAFPQHQDFQQLVAWLFQDIMALHKEAYSIISKLRWKVYFKWSFGRFEHRFGSLLKSITYTSELIDKEAVSLDIIEAAEKRQRDQDTSKAREIQWEFEQRQKVLDWLQMEESNVEDKLDWLRNRCYEGTSQWVTKSSKLRQWLQRGRGPNLLWLNGKPGSGKSCLSSQIIDFLRSDPKRHVAYFFCDFHTPAIGVGTYIFRSICSQLIRASTELTSFIFNEYVSTGQRLALNTLKRLLVQLLGDFDDVRLVFDGIDELSQAEHKPLIKAICEITESSSTCKTLIVSQDIPSIETILSKTQKMGISEERHHIRQDMEVIVAASLRNINDMHDGFIQDSVIQDLKERILEKAQGMFLWVRLVLDLLESAISVEGLRSQLDSLPRDLIEAYEKILRNMCNRCSENGIMQIRRVFSWLLCQQGKHPLQKHQIRLGMAIYPGCHVLTRDKRPFPNATDICKPFVEDGIGGSLVFIHSTVPKFLLDQGQTPFMTILDSQRVLAFSCIAQLNQALDLFSEGLEKSEQNIQLCLGLYGLLPYAVSHWIDHLIECGGSSNHGQGGSYELIQQLCMLCQKLMSFETEEPADLSGEKEPWMDWLESYPEMQKFVGLLVRIRTDGKASKEHTTGVGILTQILAKYHIIIQYILKQKSVPDVPQPELISFKTEYGPTSAAYK
ncbi:hypothetical protein F4777DRAFT_530453 [Nemania sp. FL0916]|nr:hypothetical protein F4777DRAFT_530453 [Nemania sp. FL0916]